MATFLPLLHESLHEKKIRSAMRGGRKSPPGCDLVDDGNTIVIRCQARNVAGAIVTFCFAAVWSGFLIWVGFRMSVSGSGDVAAFVVVYSVFALSGTILLWNGFFDLWGRIEIRISPDHAVLFRGIRPLGFRRTFRPREVRSVKIVGRQFNGSFTEWVQVSTTSNRIRLANKMEEPRRIWLTAMLRIALGLPMRH
ncbi:MAG: hypothetical protein AB7G17_08790 [Phycisphaerales bacterium]